MIRPTPNQCGDAGVTYHDFQEFAKTLPQAMEGAAEFSHAALQNGGTAEAAVSPVDTPPVPFDCANDDFGSSHSACSQSLSWTGKLTVLPERTNCHGGGAEPVCMTNKEKDDARAAAEKEDAIAGIAKSCIPSTGRGVDYACKGSRLVGTYYSLESEADTLLADDPVDPHFRKIAVPAHRTVKTIHLPAFKRFNLLIESFATTVATEQAMLTSINRANGAKAAGSSAWLKRQNAAALKYCRELVALLKAQRTLAREAVADLRKAHFTNATFPAFLVSARAMTAVSEGSALFSQFAKQ